MGLLEELQGLDINDIGSWSRRVKLVMAAFLGVGLVFAGYHLVIKDQLKELDKVEMKEPQLKKQYLDKKALAINLDAYKQQMVEAEETFGVLLKQLPNESEIPDLLIDMTQVGLSRGLQFQQIKPGKVVEKDFYAEKFVNVRASGTYHQIAGFVSDIAGLQRIINVDNFKITRKSGTNELTLNAVTKTYHYLDEANVE
ncbi:MAG: type 4a pilus biogenesis protein PilO [Gammaproteobacteria bacterium]|nr:type 4a pilus biogenesis protein PilO [Gammaproteobacteria bacterium]